jgi:WS/DGAT/MGAT family acyltransferase
MSETKLSSVDTAWFRMEEPANPVDIGGVLVFDGELSMNAFRDLVRERFLRFDWFEKRVVEPTGGLVRPHWEDDPNFDIDHHLHHVALPKPGDKAELQRLVSDLMSEPMDLRRPLWSFTVIDNYGDKTAVFARLHHCLGDGFALAHLMLSMADNAPEPGEVHDEHGTIQDRLVAELEEIMRHPSRLAADASLVGKTAAELGHLLTLPFDPKTSLRGELTGVRRGVWSERMELQRIKDLAHDLEATVNDVLMSAMTGAFRRYLLARGDDVEGLTIRAIVPVNLRPVNWIEEMDDSLGNRFGLVFLDLPVWAQTPLERLSRLKKNMDALKESPEAVVAFGILDALGYTPPVVEHLVQEIFGRKASVVVTNVPGPRQALYFAGHKLEDMMFWVPHPARLAVGLSIISYDDGVRVGARTDTAVVDDPESLVGFFQKELTALESSTPT